jgi:hypothetical protein
MPLKAKLDGCALVSVLCTEEQWKEAQNASKGDAHRLRMMCCQAPAYATHSPLDLRFFAHKPGFDRCPSEGESDEHESLKGAAAQAVHGCDGWQAEVEVSGDGWRADVLAVRGSVKIAIEVQISSQAKRETGTRNDRFEASEVTPFWLKGARNHFNDFGDGLQEPVRGDDLREQMASVRGTVIALLGKVERQVKLANALAKLVKSLSDWTFKIEKQGTVPACFELAKDGQRQQILLGELGAALLPTVFRPVEGKQIGADQFAGAILQLRIEAPHLRGYQSSSFKIDARNIDGSLHRLIRPILEGKQHWQGREHEEIVPGSFLHYPEDCPHCQTRYVRIPYLLIGNPKHPQSLPAKIIVDDWRWFRPVLDRAKELADKNGLPLGPLSGESGDGFYRSKAVTQACPNCGESAPEPLVSSDEALQVWPGRDSDFRFRLPVPGEGWGEPTRWVTRGPGTQAIWDALLAKRQRERAEAREAERKRKETEAADERRREAERRARLEEDRLRREAEDKLRREEAQRREQERQREAAEERRRAKEAAAESRRGLLRAEAERRIKNPERRELWLTTGQPKLKASRDAPAPRPLDLTAESQEGFERALALLSKSKI